MALPGGHGPAHWVLWGASGEYWVGTFDGREFKATTPKLKGDHGGNFYAAQAYDDLPDHRVVLVGWMNNGRYPGMPFNGQMGVPMTMELRDTPEGPRLRKWPVKELDSLRDGGLLADFRNNSARELDARLQAVPLELDDIRLELPLTACRVEIRGFPIEWKPAEGRLRVHGHEVPVKPVGNTLRLRILLDRTSVETFVEDGMAVFSDCFLPRPEDRRLKLAFDRGDGPMPSVQIHKLKSAWRP